MWNKVTSMLKRSLNPRLYPKIRPSHVRLAVTGFSGAGKTVFLTSLINHLKYHNPAAFQLSPHAPRLVKVYDSPPKKRVWDTFSYDEYRACIACKHSWPEKTRDCSQYTLSFCRDDAFLTRHKLTLYDLPGERFADAAMTYMDFAQWSRSQLAFLGVALAQDGVAKGGSDMGEGLEPVATYLSLARQDTTHAVQESDLILSYKRALAALRRQLHAYISPSTFLLDENGKTLFDTAKAIKSKQENVRGRDFIEELIRQRYVGIPEYEFCPLGETWQTGNPDLVQRLEKRYNDYRQRVATPLVRTLTSCDGYRDHFGAVAQLIRNLASPLDYMHSHEILHRDLKPENILFDSQGRCFISDLGLARYIHDPLRLTATGVPMGTLPYMSPEQLAGARELGRATDIYSLGAILYELLASRVPVRPMPGETNGEYHVRLLQERPVSPREHNPQVPRDLADICMTCLERDSAARYHSASALAEDVARFLQYESPLGIRPSAPRYLKFLVGGIDLDVYVLVGGDGRIRYEYPNGIQCKLHNRLFVPPALVQAEFTSILQPRREQARKRGAVFRNRRMIRLDKLGHGLTCDQHEAPYPLQLQASITTYFRTQVTNAAMDWRLRDGTTIRERCATPDPADFAGSLLSNPLAINLSIITADNYIYVVKRGQRVGLNPGGWSPAVSGTGTPTVDIEGNRYNPWRTALREAQQETVGYSYTPKYSDIVFFGLARVVRNGFPFLFGELRVAMSSAELESQVPQDRYESVGVIGRPFMVDSIVEWVLELYRETDEQGRRTTRAHTTIFSLLQSLKYAYPDDWLKVVRQVTDKWRETNAQY